MTFRWTTPKQLISKFLSKKAHTVTVSPNEYPVIDDSKPPPPIALSATIQVNGRKEIKNIWIKFWENIMISLNFSLKVFDRELSHGIEEV